MGGILAHAGVRGILEDRDRLYVEADAETGEWLAACELWHEKFGERPVSAGQLLLALKEVGILLNVWAGKSALAGQQRLGRALATHRDRVFGPFVIRSAGRDGHSKNMMYHLETPQLGT